MHTVFSMRLGRTLAGVTLFVLPATAQSVVFAPRVDFGLAQENAQQSVCADFDHDGNLDIAITMEGYNQGKVEVLWGDGQSDFGSSFEVSSYSAWGLCSGDFDGDGFADLVATSHGWAQHGVRIWRNDQLGGFTNSAVVSTLATSPAGVVAGDFDGDGIDDVAAISETGGWAVDWFHGNGNGTFGTYHAVANTLGLQGRRIYAGHFDADAHLDLLAIHQTGAMVLRNDSFGTGNFNASSGIPVTEAMSCAAVADLDNDGIDDIVTVGASVKVWRGLGAGAFTLLGTHATSTGALEVQLGDLDHDGQLDALLVGLGGVQIFFGQGAGAFGPPQNLPAGVYPKSGVIGDWNGDGFNDIAITCQNYAGLGSYLSVYDQLPPAHAATATAYGAGCGAPALAFVPDANGRPMLGQVATARVLGTPSLAVGVALGWSQQWAGTLPLPASLAAIGMPGCDLLQSADLFGLSTTPLTATSVSFALAVPNLPLLLGTSLYLQAYALAPGQNPLQLTASNGIDWRFGNV